ncbi:putative enterotoxin [Ophiocordyceps australis]|uniref:Putative enterotoxin n=1 Tax=Ophiocordyceps australis TaxID=1399860 RepID=A0A2C5Y3Q4_9HYPO|nr:putative enterotoxin [Ophiocordyceps australis]
MYIPSPILFWLLICHLCQAALPSSTINTLSKREVSPEPEEFTRTPHVSEEETDTLAEEEIEEQPTSRHVYFASPFSPTEVEAHGGYAPRLAPTPEGFGLEFHANNPDGPSAYLSTYASREQAVAAYGNQKGWVAVIKKSPNMFNLFSTLGNREDMQGVYAALGGVRYGQIKGWFLSEPGHDTLDLTPNTHFDPAYDMLKPSEDAIPEMAGFPIDSPMWDSSPWNLYKPRQGSTPEQYAKLLEKRAIGFMNSKDLGLALGWTDGQFPLFQQLPESVGAVVLKLAKRAASETKTSAYKVFHASRRGYRGIDETYKVAETMRVATEDAVRGAATVAELTMQRDFLGRLLFQSARADAFSARVVAAQTEAQLDVDMMAGLMSEWHTMRPREFGMTETDLVPRLKQTMERIKVIKARNDVKMDQNSLKQRAVRAEPTTDSTTPNDLIWVPKWEKRLVAEGLELQVLGQEMTALQSVLRAVDTNMKKLQKIQTTFEQAAEKVEAAKRKKEMQDAKARAIDKLAKQADKLSGSSWSKSATVAGLTITGLTLAAFGLGGAVATAKSAAGGAVASVAAWKTPEEFGEAVIAGTAPQPSAQEFADSIVRMVAQQPIQVEAAEVEHLLREATSRIVSKSAAKAADKVALLAKRRRLARRSTQTASPEARFWLAAAQRAAEKGARKAYSLADSKLQVPQQP